MKGIECVLRNGTKLQRKFTDKQLEVDKRQGINLLSLPLDNDICIYNMTNLKGGQPYHPTVTQDNWGDETAETVPSDIDEKEEENLPQLPQRSPRL